MKMAKFRQVHTSFWQDSFVLDLTPEEKYFYLYLMTNSKTTQCGIYELPIRVIEMETGYNRETCQKLLDRFIEYGKVLYSQTNKEIMIVNWFKYNLIKSSKVIACINKELKEVKTKEFLQELYGMDTVSEIRNTLSIDHGEEEEKEEEKEEKEEKEEVPYREIVSYLNVKTSSAYKPATKKTQSLIKARFNEGFTLDDFKKVIDNKVAEWLNDSKMSQYLRPETLFGTKFESYLNQKGGVTNAKDQAAEQSANDYQLPF